MTHTSVVGMDNERNGRTAEQEIQIIGCCECPAQTVRNPNYNADGGRAKPPASGDWQQTTRGRWLCPACAKRERMEGAENAGHRMDDRAGAGDQGQVGALTRWDGEGLVYAPAADALLESLGQVDAGGDGRDGGGE